MHPGQVPEEAKLPLTLNAMQPVLQVTVIPVKHAHLLLVQSAQPITPSTQLTKYATKPVEISKFQNQLKESEMTVI